ncbi:YdcF family protein [Paenibacillus glufosinatiresistens]|uniref:YdcF family protein n=1 Tax=Paenibacillus glufosinatiresistens TaxID=3070657 RepID=UPI00286DCAFA|nr:YdcF family protein [Paenibacillus sp. YX.27]
MMGNMGGSSPIRMIDSRRRRRRRAPGAKRALTAVLAMVAVSGIAWCIWLLVTINGASTSEPLQKADAGIVLGMAMWGDEPSPGLKERLDKGLELYRNGTVRHLIVSGGLDKPGLPYTEAEGMKIYLVAAGVPESAVLLENRATSTYENLKFSRAVMKAQGWESAVIVTHTFHGARALEMAEELGYRQPELALTDSKVMSMWKYKSREILAFTKWKLQDWF